MNPCFIRLYNVNALSLGELYKPPRCKSVALKQRVYLILFYFIGSHFRMSRLNVSYNDGCSITFMVTQIFRFYYGEYLVNRIRCVNIQILYKILYVGLTFASSTKNAYNLPEIYGS